MCMCFCVCVCLCVCVNLLSQVYNNNISIIPEAWEPCSYSAFKTELFSSQRPSTVAASRWSGGWQGLTIGSYLVHKSGSLSSSNLTLEAWTVPGELLVSPPWWNLGNSIVISVKEGISNSKRRSNRVNQLGHKRNDKARERENDLPSAVPFFYGLLPKIQPTIRVGLHINQGSQRQFIS